MSLIQLWLDDVRPMPFGFDIHAKTEQDAIELLKTGNITHISFDHDLGNPENGTGYNVAKFIEEKAYYGKIPPLTWTIHSANPVGRKNIESAMNNADKFWPIKTID